MLTQCHSVGIGSDFDGIGSTPKGLEDVSKYPALVSTLHSQFCLTSHNSQVAELRKRGWKRHELEGFTGRNLIRVLAGAEEVAKKLQRAGTKPVFDLYDRRTDLPRRKHDL